MKQYKILPLCLFLAATGTMQAQEKPAQWDYQSCIRYALEQNIQIKKSKVLLDESQVNTKTAKAALFPSLSFSTSHNIVNRPYDQSGSNLVNVGGSGNYATSGGSSKTNYTGSYGLNAQWTVYNGGKRLKTIEQQELNGQIAELNIDETANTIEESITQTFMQILYANESVKINENTLAVSAAQRDRAKEMLEVGSIAKSDYAQLEAQYSSDKYQLVTSQASLKNYKLQLKQLLELDGEEEMDIVLSDISDESILAVLPSKTEVYETALASRPEIQSSLLDIKASNLNVNIAKAGYYPSISLNTGIGTNSMSGTDLSFGSQLKNSWSNSVGISLSLPILNNRSTKSAVEQAQLQTWTSQLNYLDAKKTLFKTIESLWLDASSAQEQYIAATEKLKSTQISYELANEQFNVGMKNTVELLTEKNNFLSAQQEVLQAKYMAYLNIQLLRFYQNLPIEIN
ncbi:MAG TPA: TolC family protein [Candidatus Gallibacteroides avistercoris]|uniref:TolC family protein n=1 Tax=Candidatus Gallibacteroides avistercoris TaxID=2840833 RepID=A0A9D1M865_9BACT|nr:TolC family protein [Candidatus Gallibacteroides avistercoris]